LGEISPISSKKHGPGIRYLQAAELILDGARERARTADVSLPFGGVPMGVKELDTVAGWPHTEASLVFKDRTATYDSTMVSRLKQRGGANLTGQTTASEFGGLNVSKTKLNGITGQPVEPHPDRRRLLGWQRVGGGREVSSPLPPAETGVAPSASRPASTAWWA